MEKATYTVPFLAVCFPFELDELIQRFGCKHVYIIRCHTNSCEFVMSIFYLH